MIHMYTKPTKFKSNCLPSATVKAIFSEAALPLKFKYESTVPDFNRLQMGNFERTGVSNMLTIFLGLSTVLIIF